MALTIYANTGSQDSALGSFGVEFTEINVDNDEIIFSAGSDVVKDGEPIPSDSDLNQAGVFLDGTEQIVDKYFLADVSDDELKEIHLMGNQNKRYVLAFDFDAATATEPVFEAWDDSDLDTVTSTTLGSGTPSSSFYRGVTTTDALPGADWTGKRLAGSSDNHFLYLNNENGPLTGAATLYANLKLIYPATLTSGVSDNIVFVVKYATN